MRECSLKQVFGRISQKNYRKTTEAESLFNKAAGPQQIFYSRLLQQLAQNFNGIWSCIKI